MQGMPCAPSPRGSLLTIALLLACANAPPPPADDAGDESAEMMPSDPVERSAVLVRQGKLDEALAVVDEALASGPDNHELHYARGVVLQHQGKTDEAVAEWEQALKIKDDFFPARNGIGAIKLDAREFEAAIEQFTAVLQLKPDFADAHYNLALALDGAGKPKEALAALENAHKLAPQDGPTRDGRPSSIATWPRAKERQGERYVACFLFRAPR